MAMAARLRASLPMEMTLQLDIDISAAKYSNQLFDLLALPRCRMLQTRPAAIRAASQADEAVGMLFQFFLLNCTLAFLRAQLHFGDQAAEILIAGREETTEEGELTTETRRHREILEW